MIPKSPESFTTIKTKAVLKQNFGYPYVKGDVVEVILQMSGKHVYQAFIYPYEEHLKKGTVQALTYQFSLPVLLEDIITPIDSELGEILYTP